MLLDSETPGVAQGWIVYAFQAEKTVPSGPR